MLRMWSVTRVSVDASDASAGRFLIRRMSGARFIGGRLDLSGPKATVTECAQRSSGSVPLTGGPNRERFENSREPMWVANNSEGRLTSANRVILMAIGRRRDGGA